MRQSSALIIALISGTSGLLPHPAASTDIPFYASNNSSKNWCVDVKGPWARGGGSDTLKPGTQRNNFYTAETGLFSPFGKWVGETLLFRTIEGEMICDPSILPQVISFCLENRPSNEVDLIITADDKLTVNAPSCVGSDCSPPCDSLVQATAFLGHASGQRSERDRDVFRFEGDAGDEVIVTLEPEGAMGSTGEHARLVLRSHRGGALRDEADGPLPLEIEAVLPEPGSYEVAVEGRPGSSNPFRGHYQLTLRSTSEADLALEPLTSVEP